MKKIFNIAAFVCGMDEEYPYQIIHGINEFAREHAINVSYFASFGGIVENSSFDDGEYSIYKLPNFSGFDGALLLTNTFSNPVIRNAIIDKVNAAGIPSVIFECKDYEEFYDVSIDNYAVMKKLVEHLIEVHGAKTFNFISGPEANPEAIILAEHYGNPNEWLQGDEWDTIMNYDAFMEPLTWFFTGMEKHSDSREDGLYGNADSFIGAMKHHMASFSTPSLQTAMTFQVSDKNQPQGWKNQQFRTGCSQ